MSEPPTPSAVTASVEGRWVNQNGSELQLDVTAGGAVGGWFESRKGRAAAGQRYPVLGRANGTLVSFIVDFRTDGQDLGSITSFSGRLALGTDGAPALHTMWILARAFEDAEHTRPTQAWNSFLVNADVFRRPEPHA